MATASTGLRDVAAAPSEGHVSDTESLRGGTSPGWEGRISSTRNDEATPSPGFLRGETIGRYQIRSLLGAGGMGQVFIAVDLELGREVALKLMRPGRVESTLRARARLLREAQALAKLQHPNVVCVYDVGTTGDQVFIAMELVTGHTLGAWLNSGARSWRAVRDAFLAAGRGLAAAHAAGIVHRDFKPSNVIVGEKRVVVVDFGLALSRRDKTGPGDEDGADSSTFLDVTLTLTGERLGTPRYMSPEQHAADTVTPHADQFAFAASLWEALYGAPPFPGETRAQVLDTMRAAPSPPPNHKAPERVRVALARALAFRPEDRWPALADLLDELERDPAVARRRLLGVLAVSVAALAAPVAFVVGQKGLSAPDRCDGGERLAQAAWTSDARARAKDAFLATGHPTALESFARVDAAMDRKLEVWARAHHGTCEATRVQHEQSESLLDLRMGCLEQARGELAAFGNALGRDLDADGVNRAVEASAHALDLAHCSNAAELRAAVPPPPDPDTARLIARLSAEVDRLQADGNLGRLQSALTLARALLPEVRATHFAPLLARLLMRASTLETSAGDPDTGIDLLYEAARAAGEAHDDVVHAKALAWLVSSLGARGRTDEAKKFILLAEGAAERVANQPELLLVLHHEVGAFYYHSLHDPRSALPRLGLALAFAQSLYGPDSLEVGKILNSIGGAECMLGRMRDALVDNRRATEILAARLGATHPETLVTSSNLGVIETELGNYEAASVLFERDLEQSEKNYGAESHDAVIAAMNLASVRFWTGRLAEAHELADRAVRTAPRAFGAESDMTAQAIDLGAQIALEENRIDEAIAGERRASAILEKSLGPDNPALISVLLGLTQAELAAGHIGAARASATQTVAIARKSGDPHLADALLRDADVLTAERRYAEAARGYEQALMLAEKAFGPEHPIVMDILGSAVESLIATGQTARALAFAERAHAIALNRGPWVLGKAELALARALAAGGQTGGQAGGQDRSRAFGFAHEARALLEGAGYRRGLKKIGPWLAALR